MRRIARPDINFSALYTQCIRRKHMAVRARLIATQQAAVEAAQRYETLGSTMTLYQFAHPPVPDGGATKDDFEGLYTVSFAGKKGPGRRVYDKIKASAARGICPLCGQRPVGTLDHYLPQSSKWILAITPDNLVPACADCNLAKKVHVPLDEASQLFHPYFDPPDDSQWLFAEPERRAGGVSARFYVEAPPNWPPQRSQRAHNHFTLLGLGPLYATQAAEELVNMKYRLAGLFEDGGAAAVRAHLLEEAVSRRSNHTNSWQTALYDGLAQDVGFCSGDFSLA
jgi:hypothetical protein